MMSKIYIIRGVQVMLDADLAEIYGYETRYFNSQVNNNIDRFDPEARFQLTREKFDNLMCKNFTSRWGGTRYLPYAFIEEGIFILMMMLKGDSIQNFNLLEIPHQLQGFRQHVDVLDFDALKHGLDLVNLIQVKQQHVIGLLFQ